MRGFANIPPYRWAKPAHALFFSVPASYPNQGVNELQVHCMLHTKVHHDDHFTDPDRRENTNQHKMNGKVLALLVQTIDGITQTQRAITGPRSKVRHDDIFYRSGQTRKYTVQELCESRGGRPGLSVLTSLLISVDVKLY